MAESGNITEQSIRDAITQIRTIVREYETIQKDVSQTTVDVLESWVGSGRNAFESQYNTLIRKIDDFGETLDEIYNGLVDAAAAYVDTDTKVMQGFVKTTESF